MKNNALLVEPNTIKHEFDLDQSVAKAASIKHNYKIIWCDEALNEQDDIFANKNEHLDRIAALKCEVDTLRHECSSLLDQLRKANELWAEHNPFDVDFRPTTSEEGRKFGIFLTTVLSYHAATV